PASSPSPTEAATVREVNYYLSREYAYGTWDSCRNVQFGSVGGSVMLLLCGGNQECSFEEFFGYMGNRSLHNSPFNIIFKYTPEVEPPQNFTSMEAQPNSCADVVNGHSCACADCPVACPPLPTFPPAPGPWKIGGMYGSYVVMIIVYALFCVGFLTALCCFSERTYN
ncbi:unnamed protein product, partial [Cyprideis torosa]